MKNIAWLQTKVKKIYGGSRHGVFLVKRTYKNQIMKLEVAE